MSVAIQDITVNGVAITDEQINTEMQYHPAPAMLDARYQAMRALVVRELLVQRAAKLGIKSDNIDDMVDALLLKEVSIPEMSDEECERYYNNNKARFHTSPLFEVAHILYLAPPDDTEARRIALSRATEALEQIKKDPELFSVIAARDSACSSAKDGGRLGQISRKQTLPAFEAALLKMKEGEFSAEPIASEVGYHIIRVDRRVEGSLLPFNNVKDWITHHLHSQSWQRAVVQYIQIIAGEAVITGFKLQASDSPLVQ